MPPSVSSKVPSDLVDEPVYTWKDVAAHNSASSAWIVSDDVVYDITKWLDSHPGGSESLLVAAGRDCTNLIPSYHPFSRVPQSLLRRYRIGRIKPGCVREVPMYKPDSGFYREMCEEVRKYFADNHIDTKNPYLGLRNLALFLLIGAVSLAVSFNTGLPWAVRLFGAAMFGLFQAMPLIHTMHDASHMAVSHKPWLWKVLGTLSLDIWAGGSINSWHHQHVIGHHLHTNVFAVDPDLPVCADTDFRRVVREQVWRRVYQVQWLYLPIIYSLLAFKVRFQDITDTMIRQMSGNLRVRKLSWSIVMQQVLAKSFFVCWRFLLPIYYLQVPARHVFLTSCLSELVTGLWLAYNFQVSHITPDAEFPTPNEKGIIDQEWAVCQVRSSMDYAHGSTLATFFSGALNYQTIHHLFPAISQYHYPAIAPIVIRCCKKYGIKFNALPSFSAAFHAHVNHLYNFGVDWTHTH